MCEKIVFCFIIYCCVLVACTPSTPSAHYNDLSEPYLSDHDRSEISIVPLPYALELTGDQVDITKGIYLKFDRVATDALSKTLQIFEDNLHSMGVSTDDPEGLSFSIELLNREPMSLNQEVDESYQLDIDKSGITLLANTYVGLSHGLTTITQHLHHSDQKPIAALSIYDKPRYPWRGLMIDVSRHWIPKEKILENIDGMAATKMNVLHLHLSDDQAWRIESKRFPRLHLEGSDGHYFTQADIHEIVTYASDRGIRVIPEIDMPGHVTSWLVGYPDLCAEKTSHTLKKTYGVHPNVLDPTSDKTYAFLQILLEEITSLFPDDYIHIGGDEVVLTQWKENDQIKAFMDANDLVDMSQLQAYFFLKVQQIIKGLGKKMMAWNEAMRPELEKNRMIIQAWQRHEDLFESVRMGFHGVLSSGWYLDHKLPMSSLYEVDPSINPSAIQILPDSSLWRMWKMDVQISGNSSDGKLILFGKDNNLRGVLQVMNGIVAFEKASLTDNNLTFDVKSSFGTLNANINFSQDESLKGNIGLDLLNIPLTGIKIGGNDMSDGVPFPKLNTPKPLTASEQTMILGGEACMWSEWVNEDNISARIWPSTAAVAERLWSHKMQADDLSDFYRRVDHFSNYIKKIGLEYSKNQETFVSNNSSGIAPEDLAEFMSVLEETKYYSRFTADTEHSISDPMDNVADAASPESMTSYRFGQLVDKLNDSSHTEKAQEAILDQLDIWIPLYRKIEPVFKSEDKMESVEVLSLALSDLAKIAKRLMEGGTLTKEESEYYGRLKVNAQREIEGVLLAPVPHLVDLIDRYTTNL